MSRKKHDSYSLYKTKKRKKISNPLKPILVVGAVALIAGLVAFLAWPSESEMTPPDVAIVITAENSTPRPQSTAIRTPPSVNMHSSGSGVTVSTPVPIDAPDDVSEQIADAIIAYVNEERTAAGLSPLQTNHTLTRVAELHSAYQAQQDTLSHTGVADSQPADRVSAAGYNWQAVGENVLQRWDTNAQEAYQQWVDSPPHHENMMSANFSEIGVGYARHESGRVYFTMMLAHPR